MEKHFKNIQDLVDENLIVKIVGKGIDNKGLEEYLSKKYAVSNFFKDGIFKDLIIVDLDKSNLETRIVLFAWKKVRKNTKLLIISSLPYPLFPEFPEYSIENNIREIRYVKNIDLIELIREVNNSSLGSSKGNFIVYTDKDSVDEIREKTKNIERNIVVTSDSYYFVPNVCVFDTMQEKRIIQTVTGGAKMEIQNISKRDADLRAGKLTYRLISLEEYKNLPDFTEELIFRLPLHHVMIDMYEYKLDPFEVLNDFEGDKMNFIYDLFLKYEIIDYNSKVTKKGKVLRKIPFGLRTGLLCLEANSFPSLVLSSCMENFKENIFLYEKEVHFLVDYEVELNERQRSFNKFKGFSDAHTFLNMYQSSRREDLYKWCKDNHVSYEYMISVYASVDKVADILNLKEEEFDTDLFLLSVEPVIKSLYFEREMCLVLDSEDIYLNYKGEPYTLFPDSINELSKFSPLKIQGLITEEETKTIFFAYANKEII